MPLLLSVVFFVFVTAFIVLFGYRRYVLAGRVYESVGKLPPHAVSAGASAGRGFWSITNIAAAIARKLPASASTASALQLRLMSAGYRDPGAVTVLYGLKLLAMIGITLVMLFFGMSSEMAAPLRLLGVLIGVVAGFRLPDYFLARQAARRRKKLQRALPDALDLIIVCAEAGLTVDRAFNSVTQQLALVHPELTDELGLVSAEIQAGLRRREALDNLAIRTQEPEIRKFAGVVAQADRFGTSMGEALRAHGEYLRVRRRQEAEEKASKVSVKMIFPIFFFIMPCMMLVTVGPAVVVILKELGPALSGGI